MANNKQRLLFVLLFSFCKPYFLSAQSGHLIYFSDKNNSPYSISNPSAFLSSKALDRRAKSNIKITSEDLPVNPAYLDSLRDKGAQVLLSSKWLNAALVTATPAQLALIQALSFVKHSSLASRKSTTNSIVLNEMDLCRTSMTAMNYGSSFNQLSMIGLDEMHAGGFYGEGMLIAVIDAGFKNLNSLPLFDSLIMNNRIIGTYDFVDQETDVYDDDAHGTQVLSLLAAYSDGQLIGGAWKANYLLLKSENTTSESVSEEVYWVRAAEYADSAGVDIISSSIGYNTFDNSSTSHTYMDLDGNSTVITRGADIAARKGILVVNSAGNEGASSWKYLLAPADGDSVLAVGSVTPAKANVAGSSKGPTYDGRIKPDVAAQGTGVTVASLSGGTQTGAGTSFAAPLVTGLAAGLWQAFPELSNMELMYYIRRSASQYHNPDNMIGYGIPHFSIARSMILAHKESVHIFPNPLEGQIILNLPESLAGKEISVKFTDITGRLIAEETIPAGELRTDLITNMDFWEPGIYFATIFTPESKFVLKLFKN